MPVTVNSMCGLDWPQGAQINLPLGMSLRLFPNEAHICTSGLTKADYLPNVSGHQSTSTLRGHA